MPNKSFKRGYERATEEAKHQSLGRLHYIWKLATDAAVDDYDRGYLKGLRDSGLVECDE